MPTLQNLLITLGCEGGSLRIIHQVLANGQSQFVLERNSVVLHDMFFEDGLNLDQIPADQEVSVSRDTAPTLAALHTLLRGQRFWSQLALQQLDADYAPAFFALVAQHAPSELTRFKTSAAELAPGV